MFTKHGLKLNAKKTKIEYRENSHHGFEVTGLWVGHKTPKVRRKERRYIRQLVFNCEKEYFIDNSLINYHKLWNRTSGHVAKLERLGHHQARDYRKRLKIILPVYNEYDIKKIKILINKALKVPKDKHNNIGRIKHFNKIVYKLGILKRTNPKLAKSLRKKITTHYSNVKTIREFWIG